MRYRDIFLFAIVCSLASCLSMPQTKEDVLTGTTFQKDPYRKTPTLSAPLMYNDLWVQYKFRFIKLDNSENADPILQLYVIYSSNEWAFLENSHDVDGERLELIKIDRNVFSGGSISEHVAISMTKDYLLSHKDLGINVKIFGQRKDIVINVPSYYISGFLSALESKGLI